MRMIRAEALKLRRRRGLMIWSVILTIGVIATVEAVLVVLHAVNAAHHGPAGGESNFRGATETLLTEGLANFRDLDHPFQVEPLLFTSATPLEVAVNCQKPGSGRTTCQPSVLITGRLVNKPKQP